MANDKLVGVSILAAVIAGAVIYFALLLSQFEFGAVAGVVTIVFLVILGICGWLGWTMATSSAGEPAEAPAGAEPGGFEEIVGELKPIPGMTETAVQNLIDAGFDDCESIRTASQEELTRVEGIGPTLAEGIKEKLGR